MRREEGRRDRCKGIKYRHMVAVSAAMHTGKVGSQIDMRRQNCWIAVDIPLPHNASIRRKQTMNHLFAVCVRNLWAVSQWARARTLPFGFC